jgi:hypothetical protein
MTRAGVMKTQSYSFGKIELDGRLYTADTSTPCVTGR